MSLKLLNADCMDVMRGMENNSVDAIITDPPYFRVKSEAWDNQWEDSRVFLAWVGELCEQFERILKPNGSLYFFASPQMAARVECEIAKRFHVLNSITWRKGAEGKTETSRGNAANKESLRSFWGSSERIVFAEHLGADNIAKGEAGYEAKCDELRGFLFEPLRAYLADEWARAGLTKKDAEKATSTQMASHWFTTSQWVLPTPEHYSRLREYANRKPGEYLRKDYEYLRKDYEELRKDYEELRRPFSVTARDQWSEVWDYDPLQAYPGKHPCEKPLPLLCHILNASTKPGAVVFDPFAGSGSMGEACHRMGRRFIGAEMSPENHAKAQARLDAVQSQGALF